MQAAESTFCGFPGQGDFGSSFLKISDWKHADFRHSSFGITNNAESHNVEFAFYARGLRNREQVSIGRILEFLPTQRICHAGLALADPSFSACPVTFWDVFGEQGHPVRATVSEMGPLLFSR